MPKRSTKARWVGYRARLEDELDAKWLAHVDELVRTTGYSYRQLVWRALWFTTPERVQMGGDNDSSVAE